MRDAARERKRACGRAALHTLPRALRYRFPMGCRVKPAGLASKPELNGRTGRVVKYDATKGRVGVEFAPPHGLLSLRPQCLQVNAKDRSEKLVAEYNKQHPIRIRSEERAARQHR